MATAREKFQKLLRKLFQFDCAELDFGIYRIMNHKRAVIERFIDKELLDGVGRELASGALARESGLSKELAEVSEQVHELMGDEALDAEGNLAEAYHGTPLGKRYLELRSRAAQARSAPELEAEIFNHLYAFFSRYYDEGDFMSLRRYSKRDRYAIPYNGEEVHLHWANHDQYYIKTGENFTDYRYQHGGWTIAFKLRQADVEQNNNKGAKRFFLPRVKNIVLDRAAKTFTIPFEYRPLNEAEETRYGKGNSNDDNGEGKSAKKGQEGILAEALPSILAAAKNNDDALVALTHEKRKDADGEPVSLIEDHLRTYTRKNTTDYFIHKDLQGFLERELDFYLKNEILNLDDLEAGGEFRAGSWFQFLRVIKAIGRTIIPFLGQIENLQKRLFEKKKFVTEVHYCVTLDRVPEELYPEIAKNKAQIREWKDLFLIQEIQADLVTPSFTEPVKLEFLKANRHLVIDTCHFSQTFLDRVTGSPEFLIKEGSADSSIDGVLIHAENFQALSLTKNRYQGAVKCMYIDFPYNTGNGDFLYKDSYKHSSWLAMTIDRLAIAWHLLTNTGVLFASIDDEELPRFRVLMDHLFGAENKLGTVVWKGATDNNPTRIVVEHEFLLCFAKSESNLPAVWENPSDETKTLMFAKYDDLKKQLSSVDAIQVAFREWIRENRESLQPLTHYDRVDQDGPYTGGRKVHNPGKEGYRYDVIHPVTHKPCKQPARGYRFPESTMRTLLAQDRVLYGDDHTQIIQIKEYLKDYSGSFKGLIELDSRTGANALEALFGSRELFKNPKPVQFISHLLEFTSGDGDLICDFVAGSGTTAHAIIGLCRKDAKQRKYLLVEMANHFDTVLKPRIKKVIYSKDWTDGKPVSRHGSSHCFKYLRLESYEDALDNITFKPPTDQPEMQFEDSDYVLCYMLDFETKSSDTLLNVAKLDAPFDYKLRRHGRDEPLPVDLPETFNYLIGLQVRTRCVHMNGKVRYLVYRGLAEGRETAVVWRTTRGWEQKEFEADRDFVRKHKLVEGAEDIYVNTDSFIAEARSLDPVFKRLMFAED